MIHKVWVINADTIENIFVFGNTTDEIFSAEDKIILKNFDFNIEENNKIIQSPVQIHKDDSIMQIKKKILNEFGPASNVSYHELYLFAYVPKMIDIYSAFNASLLPKTNYMNKDRFTQFMRALSGPHTLGKPFQTDKEVNTFDDISIKQQKNEIVVAAPLGLQTMKQPFMFSANPFDLIDTSPKNLAQTEYSLLMNHGDIIGQNIFVCLAHDVLQSGEQYIAKTYYPYLAAKSIFSTADIEAKKPQLMAETKTQMDPRHFRMYELVDLFYNVHDKAKDPLTYLEKGIKHYKIAIKPTFAFIVPLEALFKNMHATAKYKFMKLNLGVRRENIYRIYSNSISKTGRKMPALPRNTINSLAKNIGRHKQISVYIDESKITVDIESNGVIVISGEFKMGTRLDEIEALLQREVNPLLDDINGYLQNSGYKIAHIERLRASNIAIMSMDYVISVPIKKKVDLSKIAGCLYALFDVFDADINKEGGADLRFKRVDNYREMDQQTLLITEIIKKTGRESDVINALINYHDMTPEEAVKRIAQYLKEVSYRNVNTGADVQTLEIVENPGLPIKIHIDVAKSALVLTVDQINHMGYLDTLGVYFDSLVRILTDPKQSYNQQCSAKSAPVKEQHIIESIVEPILEEVKPARAAAFAFDEDEEEEKEEEITEEKELSPVQNIQQIMDEINAERSSSEDFVGIEKLPSSDSSDLDLTGIEIEGGDKSSDEEEDGDDIDSNSDSDSEEGYLQKNKDLAKNSNPFLQRLQKADPAVFMQSEKGRFNVYARTCQSIRQPVVLTEEEKARIDKKSPGSYTRAMKFGSTPDKQHYYICPRFWCSKTNTSMTEEQVKNGECDPEYLHEFKNPKNPIEHVDEKGNYIDHYPGFVKNPKLKYCMPCCFASQWDAWKKDKANKWVKNKQLRGNKDGTVSRRKAKDEWILDPNSKVDSNGVFYNKNKETGAWEQNTKDVERPRFIEKCEADEEETANKSSAIIFNPEKREISVGRWGYLQYAAQHFMRIRYDTAMKPNNAAYLQDDAITFLRYGVEPNETNSFLAVCADLYANGSSKPPSIEDFAKLCASATTLDMFVKFGNASFTALFRPATINIGDETIIEKDAVTINPDTYKDTETFKQGYPEEVAWEMAAAYEAYKAYIKETSKHIDPAFLWELLTNPNKALFPSGINFVIMDILNNDVTDHVEVMCPTNTYSKTKFDIDKPTAFIVKQESTYNPVYMFNNGTQEIVRTFKKDTKSVSRLLKMLNETLNNYCKPRGAMPHIYKYAEPVYMHVIEETIKKTHKILAQAVNYQGKTIALQIQNIATKAIVYLPCHPAAPSDEYPKKLMDDVSLWTTYETTRNNLIALEAEYPILKCKPIAKAQENKLIVGLITQTNQFVPVSDPNMNMKEDGLPLLYEWRKSAEMEFEKDAERESIIRNIKIESDYYNLFRSTIKALLERPENHKYRDYLLSIKDADYNSKLKNIAQTLLKLTFKTVEFITYDEEVIATLYPGKSVYACGKDKVSGILKDGCKLVLPLNNLVIPARDNRLLYYYRIADEICRYGRMHSYLLNPKHFLNTGDTNYSVKSDEFIVLESSLLGEYYDKQTAAKEIPGEIPYEYATAENQQLYPNTVSLSEQEEATADKNISDLFVNCVEDANAKILGDKNKIYWIKKIFKESATEILFKQGTECSFGPMMKILIETQKRKYNDIDEIRALLWVCYRPYLDAHLSSIVKLLRDNQGKGALLRGVETAQQFYTAIISSGYFISSLDYLVLAAHMHIPIVLFTNDKSIEDMNYDETNWMLCGLKNDEKVDKNKFYFVRSQKKMEMGKQRMMARTYALNELGDMKKTIQESVQTAGVMTVDKLFAM